MMKSKRINRFSDIESFDDFHYETERLVLKRKLIEAKMQLAVLNIGKAFSFSNLVQPLVKEFILPKISQIIASLLKRTEGESHEE
jgi:hypothetical protein